MDPGLEKELAMDRQIDPESLDVNVCEQADLFMKWAERYVRANADADDLEFELKRLEAGLQMDIRKKPQLFKLESLTEKAIMAAVIRQDVYASQYHVWMEAKSDAAWLGKAVVAMEMRKRMLETMVTLHGQEYFAGPSTPRNLADVWKKHNRNREENVKTRQLGTVRKRKALQDEDE